MLVICQIVENVAKNLFELFFVVRMHVAANMLSFILKLPFEARILCSVSVDHKDDRIHVQMDWQLIGFTFLAVKVQDELLVILAERDCTIH